MGLHCLFREIFDREVFHMSRIKTQTVSSMTEGSIWKGMLQFFLPIMLGTLLQQLYSTVDSIILGRFVALQFVRTRRSTLFPPCLAFHRGHFIPQRPRQIVGGNMRPM